MQNLFRPIPWLPICWLIAAVMFVSPAAGQQDSSTPEAKAADHPLTAALRLAPVALVMPMDYTSLLWATLLGAWLFSELPTPWTWVGAPVIIISGLVIVWREHRLARRAAVSASLSN